MKTASNSPRINSMSIGEYRSCISTEFIANPHLSVFIGPNGSGKSNILHAVTLLSKVIQLSDRPERFGENYTVSPSVSTEIKTDKGSVFLEVQAWGFTDDSNADNIQKADIKLNFRGLAAENKSIQMYSPNLIYYLKREEILKSRRAASRIGRHLYLFDEDPPAWCVAILERAIPFLSNMQYFGASRFTNPGACPVSFEVDRDGVQLRGYNPNVYVRLMHSMYRSSVDAKDAFGQFREIIEKNGLKLVDRISFKAIKSSSVDVMVRTGARLQKQKKEQFLVIPQFHVGTQIMSPNQLSDGTFRTIALLYYLIVGESSLLLIEEPEVCVHHGLLTSIMELVKARSESTQVFLTTHSDYVLDYVQPENVFIVKNEKTKGTTVKTVKKSLSKDALAALKKYLRTTGNLGEYWREGGLEGA